MAPSVYLETSILSYLAARPSRDLVTSAHQQLTVEWWNGQRTRFAVHISELVVQEASAGDGDAVRRRLSLLDGLPILTLSPVALDLARYIISTGGVPRQAAADALHIAVAAANGMDYLLTWNCRHIANAEMRSRIEHACRARRFAPPVLCTPEELMGE